MALKETVGLYQFVDAFTQAGRKENFSRLALENLHEYYEALSEDIGEDIEFDVVGICCEWSEYDNLEDLKEAYSHPGLSDATSFAEAADVFDNEATTVRVYFGSEIQSLLIPEH